MIWMGDPADETVRFGLDGSSYEIDLSSAMPQHLRGALEAVHQGRATRRRFTSARQDAASRAWARTTAMQYRMQSGNPGLRRQIPNGRLRMSATASSRCARSEVVEAYGRLPTVGSAGGPFPDAQDRSDAGGLGPERCRSPVARQWLPESAEGRTGFPLWRTSPQVWHSAT